MSAIQQSAEGELIRVFDGQKEVRLVRQTFGACLLTLGDEGDEGWREGWTYPTMVDGLNDFMVWEPGVVAICAICQRERGGDDPPGRWIRHRPSDRRRIRIMNAQWPGLAAGWFEYRAA